MPTVKEQMQTARAHIQLKQYDKARAILRQVDHPTATQWLAKLDDIAPVAAGLEVEAPKNPTRSRRRLILLILVAVLLFAVIVIAIQFNRAITGTQAIFDRVAFEFDVRRVCMDYTDADFDTCDAWTEQVIQRPGIQEACAVWEDATASMRRCLEDNGVALP